MRGLKRDKTDIYFSNYIGKTELTDEYEMKTGEYVINYTYPQKIKANVSASRGNTESDMFGVNLNYTKTMIMNKGCTIDENSIIWINCEPIGTNGHLTGNVNQTTWESSSLGGVNGAFTFRYTNAWKYGSENVTLSTYGITITGTPRCNDEVTVLRMEVGGVVRVVIMLTSLAPHNYIVVQKAESKNSISYAIKEVDVTQDTDNIR